MKTFFYSALVLSVILFFSVSAQAQDNSQEKSVKDFQLSLFPGLGTDGLQSSQYRYKVSLNLFAGVTGGLDGFEAGGFMNINKGNVQGVQFAGFGNVVNGNFSGFQSSGFMNVINGETEGLNFAGFMNTINGDYTGIQGAGFMNVTNGSSESISMAGFMNVNRNSFAGIRLAGFMNTSGQGFQGFQSAGFMNVAKDETQGISMAGFGNVSGKTMQGIQMAGFMNIADDMQGIQAAGFLNVAKQADGIQLGFINYADTINGLPVGFLSIVKKGGLRQWEVGASDAMYANASFKIGVPLFYNIFSFGVRPEGENFFFGFGYGVGSTVYSGEKSSVLVEAHSYQLESERLWQDEPTNLLSELRVLYQHDLTSQLSLFAGPVLYNHTWDAGSNANIPELSPGGWDFYNNNFHEDWNTRWWVGLRGGLVFNFN